MGSRKRLLLVEDQAIIAMAQAKKLRKAGYEVAIAHSGEAAVEAALGTAALGTAAGDAAGGGKSVDLILMDIDLGPGIDGPEAAQRILAARSIPIVFLSSHSEREMVERVRNITRYGYVIKNSGEFVLESSIEMAFELFDAHRRVESERKRIELLMESMNEAFYLKDAASGEILQLSPAYGRIWGISQEDLRKDPQSFMKAVHPEDLPVMLQRREEMAAGGPSFQQEYRIIRPDGSLRWVFAQTRRIEDPTSGATLYAAAAQDITERKLAEIALEDERRRLSAVLEAIPSLVILTGPDSETPIYVSANSRRITGYDPEELRNGFKQLVHEDDKTRAGLAIREAFAARSDGRDFEFKAIRKDLSLWFASASWQSIYDGTGAYKGRIFQIQDISERKKADLPRIERIGRPRRYALEPLPGFRDAAIARAAAVLVELSERVLDQLEDLPAEALYADQAGTGLSIGRLALHLAWAEMSWIGRLTGAEAPRRLADELAAGALGSFGTPLPPSGGADRFKPLYRSLRDDYVLAALRGCDGAQEPLDSRGLRIDAAGVMDHLRWHWTYHSGHIGLLRLHAGYDYTWTFGDEVSGASANPR